MIYTSGKNGYLGQKVNLGISITKNNLSSIDLSDCTTLYHLGGLSRSGYNYLDYLENVTYTGSILKKINPSASIIFTSTAKIYEGHYERPTDPYAMSKFMCEKLIYLHYLKYNNIYTIFRLANIVSNDITYGFLKELTDQIKNGHVKYVSGSFRPFVKLEDVLKVINMELPIGVFNVVNDTIRIEDVLDIASQYANFTTEELNLLPIKINPHNNLTQYGWSPKNSYDVLDEYFAQAL